MASSAPPSDGAPSDDAARRDDSDDLGPLLPPESLALRDVLPTEPDPVVLTGPRVRLRPATLDDAGELHRISSGAPVERLGRSVEAYDPDDLIWRYMPIGPFADEASFTAVLDPMLREPGWRTFVVEDATTGEALGSASLIANSPQDLKVEIGSVWYTPAVQDLGVNLEACRLLLAHLFGLGYRRVEWKCHARNLRSRAAAIRSGFRFEGVQEAHTIQKGRRRDTAWFRILSDEWPDVAVPTD